MKKKTNQLLTTDDIPAIILTILQELKKTRAVEKIEEQGLKIQPTPTDKAEQVNYQNFIARAIKRLFVADRQAELAFEDIRLAMQKTGYDAMDVRDIAAEVLKKNGDTREIESFLRKLQHYIREGSKIQAKPKA
jgi:hypothetical protein